MLKPVKGNKTLFATSCVELTRIAFSSFVNSSQRRDVKAFSFEVVHERTAFLASSSSGTENVMPFLIIEVKLLKRAKTAFSVTSVSCDLVAMFRRSATGLRDALVFRASVIFFSSSVTVLTEISPFFALVFCFLRGGREAVDFGAMAKQASTQKIHSFGK